MNHYLFVLLVLLSSLFFTVPSSFADHEYCSVPAKTLKKEMASYAKEISGFLKVGRKMAEVKKTDMPQCMAIMRNTLPQVNALNKKIDRLPKMIGASFHLGVAAVGLRMCNICSSIAECDSVSFELEEYENSIKEFSDDFTYFKDNFCQGSAPESKNK